jgi:hypothetical protein
MHPTNCTTEHEQIKYLKKKKIAKKSIATNERIKKHQPSTPANDVNDDDADDDIDVASHITNERERFFFLKRAIIVCARLPWCANSRSGYCHRHPTLRAHTRMPRMSI